MPRVGGARAQALEFFDTPQLRQEPPSRAWGQVEVECIPAEGCDIEELEPTGHLVTGTPRQAAFDESMVEVRAHLVRAELVGRTAVELGSASDSGHIGLLGFQGQPLQLHITDHLST